MYISIGKQWAGSQRALNEFTEQIRMLQVDPTFIKKMAAADEEDEDEEVLGKRLMQQEGSVGIVHIEGRLWNINVPWLNSWVGATGYGEIRSAVLSFAEDSDVKSILLAVDSGGGGVDGMSDAARAIQAVDQTVKPVFSHTSTTMCSAAYFLGASARRVMADEMSEVGSIGVIATHTSYERMLAEEGLDVTVIRSGKYKALASPYEKLSAKAREIIQAECDYTYGKFIKHVAAARHVTEDYTREYLADGRVFMADDAYSVGLVDGIMTADEAFARAEVAQNPNPPQHGAPSGA